MSAELMTGDLFGRLGDDVPVVEPEPAGDGPAPWRLVIAATVLAMWPFVLLMLVVADYTGHPPAVVPAVCVLVGLAAAGVVAFAVIVATMVGTEDSGLHERAHQPVPR